MTITVDEHRTTDEALEQQAWDWLRLLNTGQVQPQDAAGFKAWLEADPAHKAAFRAARLRWNNFKPVAGELLRSRPDIAAAHARTLRGTRGPMLGRRAFLGAAVSAAAVAGIAVVNLPAGLWPAPDAWGADWRTSTGEQRAVTLADGVRVTLNTQTSVRRREVNGRVTGIDLLTGEAAIDLLAYGGQPFGVAAGVGRSESRDGRFEVRHLQGKVCVTCIDGELRVDHPTGAHQLRTGQQIIYDDSTLSGIAAIEPAQVSAWRHGELIFERARLGDVLEEINRYRAGRVILMNEAVRNQPVSGTFFIASMDQALSQLQHTFELRARVLPGGLLLLS